MSKQKTEEAFCALALTLGYDPRVLSGRRSPGELYSSSSLQALRDGWDGAVAYLESKPRTKAPTYFTADHAQSILLRDVFAAEAMAAMLTCPFPMVVSKDDEGLTVADYVSKRAYFQADAMLKARSA